MNKITIPGFEKLSEHLNYIIDKYYGSEISSKFILPYQNEYLGKLPFDFALDDLDRIIKVMYIKIKENGSIAEHIVKTYVELHIKSFLTTLDIGIKSSNKKELQPLLHDILVNILIAVSSHERFKKNFSREIMDGREIDLTDLRSGVENIPEYQIIKDYYNQI